MHRVTLDAVLAGAVDDDAVTEVAADGPDVVPNGQVLDHVAAAALYYHPGSEVLHRALAHGDSPHSPQQDPGAPGDRIEVAGHGMPAEVEGDVVGGDHQGRATRAYDVPVQGGVLGDLLAAHEGGCLCYRAVELTAQQHPQGVGGLVLRGMDMAAVGRHRLPSRRFDSEPPRTALGLVELATSHRRTSVSLECAPRT